MGGGIQRLSDIMAQGADIGAAAAIHMQHVAILACFFAQGQFPD